MNTPIIVTLVLDSYQHVKEAHPNDCPPGHINEQVIRCIAENMVRKYGGKSIHDTIFKQAAVLLEGIVRLHPFTDGNKRTALLSTARFLYAHDQLLFMPAVNSFDTPQFIVDIAKNHTDDTAALLNNITAALEMWSVHMPQDGDSN